MAATLLPDVLWNFVEPFLPISPVDQTADGRASPNRACLTGIVFVLRSGIPWQMFQRGRRGRFWFRQPLAERANNSRRLKKERFCIFTLQRHAPDGATEA
jgi:transposase